MHQQLSEFRRLKKQRRGPISENIATAVVEGSSESLHGTVRVLTISRTLVMPYSTGRHIMREILNFYLYKIQGVQQLKLHDTDARKAFELEFLARMGVDDSLPWNILWTDEAYFHLNRQVNSHNCHFWETEPPAVHVKALHDTKVVQVHRLIHSRNLFFLNKRPSMTYHLFC
ncbi:uncharacterized protein TNCV_3297511 [Trichonephila clavipes]|uniref:Transposase n=1 Tax=Trichonephila clavipes TaxID=2585209 RepID=A0A8X6VTD3_TRICX|nr:uncharacterized protein TNCV_3297511 [Trichonephila clavipes]